ncbi:rRNA-processing protein UTP23 homolog [Anthonomus grandis grandis]|uniref:rRNA-processing protein UTP23 homolog n=1 Tax=Anthonomus grandis grandis TaxID=2921223 RepID=UPI0021661133|nr:rRNA-processing protein UTP23 homolog [Anthonomus grandis grandis]
MKIRRYKKVNKHLGFFTNNFGFRQPYQLLADGTFCFAALNNKINVANDIPKYLQSEIKLITTQCAIIEMEKLGPKLNGALIILKKYVLHKCGHEGKPIPGSQCLLNMVAMENPKHYIVCTQDRDLQDKLRLLPGVPLLYLHVKTPVLEQPSEASIKRAEEKMTGLVQSEVEKLKQLKEEEGISTEETKVKRRKKKGPNPLSCKKKQKKPQENPIQKKESKPEIEKKKRKKIRIPQHVKEEILKRTFMKINKLND